MMIVKLVRSVGFGLSGLLHVIKSEPNMRNHLLAMALVIAAGAFFQISAVEWLAVVFCIGIVLSIECLNSAVERLADRVSKEQHPLIRQAKDSAAAAVLVVSIMSAVVGCVVFLPKVWKFIMSFV